MTGSLSREQVEFYRSEGYLSPFDAISPDKAGWMRAELDRYEAETGKSMVEFHFKAHLYFRWSYELSRNEKLLDAIEGVIGPNIMVFASKFWIKPAGDGSFVSWHQDSAYFGLDPHEEVTAWVALTDSTPENGCIRVLPGSHTGPAMSHVETYDKKNLLARGQEIRDVDESKAVDQPLRAGQFSLHHERLVHGSLPNNTDDARIGLGLFCIPTHVRSTIGRRSACLVRGIDEYGHWDADPIPEIDRDPRILEHMHAAHRGYVNPAIAQEAGAT